MAISRGFIKLEVVSSSLLLVATISALILSNSPWSYYYDEFFNKIVYLNIATFTLKTNLKYLINEGLMTIFFLVVGLEVKYEFLQGSLNSLRASMLPIVAAIGGMIVPAIIYVGFNYHGVIGLRGWAIPTATDIAFALGVLSLLGSRIQPALRAFLTALAIIDDVIAIIIIALFYTDHLVVIYLALAFIFLMILLIMNVMKINNLILYCTIGIFLWVSLLRTGIHPTLAGVLLAFSIPINQDNHNKASPLHLLMKKIHPLVALGILPLFAFANAGLTFFSLSPELLHFSIVSGIILGLFLGKQFGIFGASWIAIKFGISKLPASVKWIDLYGVSIICGIGFTISLFIGALAFGDGNNSYILSVKLGVLAGSVLSGLVGFFVLLVSNRIYKKRNCIKK